MTLSSVPFASVIKRFFYVCHWIKGGPLFNPVIIKDWKVTRYFLWNRKGMLSTEFLTHVMSSFQSLFVWFILYLFFFVIFLPLYIVVHKFLSLDGCHRRNQELTETWSPEKWAKCERLVYISFLHTSKSLTFLGLCDQGKLLPQFECAFFLTVFQILRVLFKNLCLGWQDGRLLHYILYTRSNIPMYIVAGCI